MDAQESQKAFDSAWLPGTVRLELLRAGAGAAIMLQQRPTRDPNDPLNWPRWRKALNFGMACVYTLVVFAQFNASIPTWAPMADELGFSAETLTGTWAMGCASLAIGAVTLVPFALKFGLRPVYVLSSAASLAVMCWGARTVTEADWWGVNAVQCWLGSLAEVMVQMTVANVFFLHQRGRMNAVYIWGWRWVWWWMAIIFAISLVFFGLCFEESKFNWAEAPQIITDGSDEKGALKSGDERSASGVSGGDQRPDLKKKTEQSDGASLNNCVTAVQIDSSLPRRNYWRRLTYTTTTPGPWSLFLRHAYQPFQILVTIPGVAYMSLVYGIMQAWYCVMAPALGMYLPGPPWDMSPTAIGLMNLAPFIGTTLGSLVCGPLSDWLVLKLAKRNGGIYEPEMRLWVFVPFIPFTVAGAFWFGYAVQEGQSWAAVAVAFGICNFGTAPLSSIALTYMTDAYTEIIGDTLVGLTFVRNTVSTALVFAMVPWIDAVGIAIVFNTMSAIGLAILLFAFVFIWMGKRWRYESARRYRDFATKQFDPRPVGN